MNWTKLELRKLKKNGFHKNVFGANWYVKSFPRESFTVMMNKEKELDGCKYRVFRDSLCKTEESTINNLQWIFSILKKV